MTSRILIKIGGRAFDGEDGFRALARAIRANPEAEVIIVHGGGAEISQALKAAGRETVFVDGMRVTQAEDVQIVESVLSGADQCAHRRLAVATRGGLPPDVRQDRRGSWSPSRS